jgi:hypothetical protein
MMVGQFTQKILVMVQHLEEVMAYTYLMMRVRIPVHTHIFIPTKLHLVWATQTPSWQEHGTFNRQKLKFSILSRTYLNIYSCTKKFLFLKVNLKCSCNEILHHFLCLRCKENSNWPNKSRSQTILSRFSTRRKFSLSCDFLGGIN